MPGCRRDVGLGPIGTLDTFDSRSGRRFGRHRDPYLGVGPTRVAPDRSTSSRRDLDPDDRPLKDVPGRGTRDDVPVSPCRGGSSVVPPVKRVGDVPGEGPPDPPPPSSSPRDDERDRCVEPGESPWQVCRVHRDFPSTRAGERGRR